MKASQEQKVDFLIDVKWKLWNEIRKDIFVLHCNSGLSISKIEEVLWGCWNRKNTITVTLLLESMPNEITKCYYVSEDLPGYVGRRRVTFFYSDRFSNTCRSFIFILDL